MKAVLITEVEEQRQKKTFNEVKHVLTATKSRTFSVAFSASYKIEHVFCYPTALQTAHILV